LVKVNEKVNAKGNVKRNEKLFEMEIEKLFLKGLLSLDIHRVCKQYQYNVYKHILKDKGWYIGTR
jgi:hypothetical protein